MSEADESLRLNRSKTFYSLLPLKPFVRSTVDRYKIYVLMLSGFLAALPGIILLACNDSAIYTAGAGYELRLLAAPA